MKHGDYFRRLFGTRMSPFRPYEKQWQAESISLAGVGPFAGMCALRVRLLKLWPR